MYSFDNISLKQDNKRWFPVMGEIHYSRYPHEYWRESLLKMKAGGVDVGDVVTRHGPLSGGGAGNVGVVGVATEGVETDVATNDELGVSCKCESSQSNG